MAEDKAKLVGINHIALEVGDVNKALESYNSIFNFQLRSKLETKAFIDMGDQFIALSETENREKDKERHFGLVVDDLEKVEEKVSEHKDVELIDTSGLDFYDPWGNRFQIIEYSQIQFTKADHILRGMNLQSLEKSEKAIRELKDKNMSADN